MGRLAEDGGRVRVRPILPCRGSAEAAGDGVRRGANGTSALGCPPARSGCSWLPYCAVPWPLVLGCLLDGGAYGTTRRRG